MSAGKDSTISDPMDQYLQAMAWWNAKTLEQKARTVGEDVLDKWIEEIIRDEYLKTPEMEAMTNG